MPKKKQRSEALSFLDEESGDSSPRLPAPAPQQLLRHPVLSPVNSRVSVGSSAVTTTSVEPRSGSASSGRSGAQLSAKAQEKRSHSSSPGTPPLSSTVAGSAAPPDLVQIVQMSGTSLQQAALDLVDAYQQDPAPAIFEIVHLAVAVSGSKLEVKLETLEQLEMAEVVEEAAALDQLPDRCPVIGNTPEARKLRSSFCQLLEQVVSVASNSVIYDGIFMDQLAALFVCMSGSKARALRYTGTLAALHIVTALAAVEVKLNEQKARSRRQLQLEERKSAEARAADRLEVLTAKLKEVEENLAEVATIIEYLVQSVFILRWKDIAVEIRGFCMEQLGTWIHSNPARFLETSYLKYLGWALHDQESEVRLACVRALSKMFKLPNTEEHTEEFTTRFLAQMVRLTLDKDIEVAVEAVLMLVELSKQQPDAMSDDEREQLFLLCFSQHRKVGQAAGVFLQQWLVTRLPPNNLQATKSKRGKPRHEDSFLLKDIITFAEEIQFQQGEPFLVDSLVCCSALQAWEAFVDLLVEEPGLGEEKLVLETGEEVMAVALLVASVKQAVERQPPQGRGGQKRVLTVKDQEEKKLAREAATVSLLPALPHLLQKFLHLPDTVALLLDLLHWLNLEMYTVGRQGKALDELLLMLNEVMKQPEHVLLYASLSRALEQLCTPGLSIQARCETVKGHMFDGLANRYRESLDDFSSRPSHEQSGQGEFEAFHSSLAMLAALFPRHDLTSYNLWASLLEICRWREDDEAHLVTLAISCCHSSLLWQLTVKDKPRSRQRPGEIQERAEALVEVCKEAIQFGGEITAQAFNSLCHLLLLLGQDGTLAEGLHLPIDKPLTDLLIAVIEDVVLDEALEIDETLLKEKRKMLSAFCSLISNNVLPVKCFAFVLRRLLSQQENFGGIIKSTLDELRNADRGLCGRVMVEAMTEAVGNLRVKDRANGEFARVQGLARKMALNLGVDGAKNREAVVNIHRWGIEQAAEIAVGGNLMLELLKEFVGRLMPNDRKEVLAFLGSKTESLGGGREEQAIFDSYVVALKGVGKKDKRRPHPN